MVQIETPYLLECGVLVVDEGRRIRDNDNIWAEVFRYFGSFAAL